MIVGSKPALVDYNVWPWFERFPAIDPGKTVLPSDRFPKLTAWVKRMEQLPAVKNIQLDNKAHNQFIESFVAGEPDFAIGLRRE